MTSAAIDQMHEALQLVNNVLFLLADEVDALGLGAYRVREKVAAALKVEIDAALWSAYAEGRKDEAEEAPQPWRAVIAGLLEGAP